MYRTKHRNGICQITLLSNVSCGVGMCDETAQQAGMDVDRCVCVCVGGGGGVDVWCVVLRGYMYRTKHRNCICRITLFQRFSVGMGGGTGACGCVYTCIHKCLCA